VTTSKFEFGAHITTTSPDEHRGILADQALADQRAAADGFRYGRLNPEITGIASGGALAMGGDFPNSGPAGTIVTSQAPRAGYCWMMRRMSVSGLTTGVTPDVVGLHRRTPPAGIIGAVTSNGVWQFNGNNYAYTFSFGEMVFMEGETPVLTSVGAFAATGVIKLSADFVELPQPMMYKGLR
jgi:hypothetical protein